MRSRFTLGLLGLVAFASPSLARAQSTEHLNAMIPLHEKGLPVFGISHPAISRGRGGGGGGRGGAPGAGGGGAAGAGAGATMAGSTAGAVSAGAGAGAGAGTGAGATNAAPPPPPIVLADVAKETFAYKLADFSFTTGAPEAFYNYMVEMKTAGASVKTHPFAAKIPIWHNNPEAAKAAMYRQLNAGHVGVMMQEVESAQEVRDAVKAMRFVSAGGTRPDSGIATAAAYWGLSEADYKKRADVWPVNKNGDLIAWVIIESTEGLAKVDEIVSEPSVGVVWVGYGTLGGVFRGDPDGREKAAASILAACKKYNKPCGFPTNNPAEMNQRYAEGWRVFVMQRRDENGFGAVETGRKLGGR